MTYSPRICPACTPAILRFQERVEGLDHVDRSMNEYHVDDSKETVVRDDPLIRMRLAYPKMQCELHLIWRINSGNWCYESQLVCGRMKRV